MLQQKVCAIAVLLLFLAPAHDLISRSGGDTRRRSSEETRICKPNPDLIWRSFVSV